MILQALIFSCVCLHVSDAVIGLTKVSSLYMPYDYNTNKGVYDFNRNAVEETAYDARNKIIYTAGSRFLHVVDISKPKKPVIIHKHRLSHNVEDLAICGGYLAFVQEHSEFPALNGQLKIFKLYNRNTKTLDKMHTVTVGASPDMILFSSDCRTIVVSNEGKASISATNVFHDPEPTITFINNFEGRTRPIASSLDFMHLNAKEFQYIMYGIRKPYAPSTFSMNLEPESIAFSNDETKLYVTLQENNGIMVIDMATRKLENIFALGFKSWAKLGLDASSADGGTRLKNYPIYSLYQPDGLAYFENNGEGYIITANEGADIELDQAGVTFQESERASTLAQYQMFSQKLPQELLKSLSNNRQLGQLEISKVDGLDQSGKIERVFFYGGRGFSIWRARDMKLQYDSGDEVARKHKQFYNSIFNSDSTTKNPTQHRPMDLKDVRSDNKGSECETVVMGEVNGKRIIILAIDRVSTIMVYSLPAGSTRPVFESVFRGGRLDKTFSELYKNMDLGDLRPSDLTFVHAKDSPNGTPMLMVTGRASGTISLYHVGNVVPNSSSYLKVDLTTWTVLLLLATVVSMGLFSA
ncbi:mesenchyme-specific cell surface glycoprotein-like [Antedon mediterranea]|uniref:mesenchyme-specific cell surface glycoprotein-like n=1 Tax=Antedon mediterranea TaxID=105859 RepID=UPI003AF4B49E